jgi:hypothetical protein
MVLGSGPLICGFKGETQIGVADLGTLSTQWDK